MDASSSTTPGKRKAPKYGLGGIIAILVAIGVGVAVGLLYGRQMWLATGGPATEISRLEKAKVQKEEFAKERDAAGDTEEAVRLRSHIPKIEERLSELEAVQSEYAESSDKTFSLAYLVAELTHFVGDIFIQVLKMLVIPLVVTSMICGITSLGDVTKLGKVGGLTIAYYVVTMAIAVGLGIGLVLLIDPGTGADDTFAYVKESVQEKQGTSAFETLLNVFRGRPGEAGGGMFPSNLFLAATKTNVLALIAFSLLFGGALTTLGDRGKPAIAFFDAANEAVMKIVHLVMWFAPVGIYGLVAWNIAKNGGREAFFEELTKLAWYVTTVISGLGIHVVVLATILLLLGRRNPLRYVFGISRALLTAITTASSSATLPITMECVEENNGVSQRSSSFVLPLGATINMDGTALYEAVAVIFIAQSQGMDLSMAQLIIIFITATLAAVGAAGIPEAGLVTMVIVLQAADIPIAGIGTILAIDWFLDRMRTTVNVYGDAIGAAVIDEQVVKHESGP